jgi:hypothetical protein
VSTSSAQRDTAWVRLAAAEARAKRENARSAAPPGTPMGVGEFYCAALRTVGGWLSPKEAIAATLDQAPDKVKQGIPPSAGARIAAESEIVQDPSVQTMMIEGLSMELQIAQGTIDRHRVEIEKKFAIATACIVFVLLGAPIALRFPRGGVGLTIGVSLGVFGIYYVGLLGGEALADRDLVDPALAMWFTNILLGIVGVVLTARLGSEGSTARGSETSEWWSRVLERFRRKRGVA